jgi:2-polyprenyl-3-methyl-5-hydroxy-6-metoxy-1,4-benzoquinol methylase
MAIKQDPEENEIRALLNMADLTGFKVLEIGCGDGRLTWRYAQDIAHVTAIDPFEPSIRRARENIPSALYDRVELFHISFDDFALGSKPAEFDVAILAWSL